MNNKVSVHWQGPKAFNFPALVEKVMDPGDADPAPGKDKVVRFFIEDAVTNEWIAEGRDGIYKWWDWIVPKILKIAHWAQGTGRKIIIELPNEPQPMSEYWFRKALDNFSFEATLLIESLANGLNAEIYCCAYNFSVGWPNWGDIKDFAKSLKVVHYAASHEYNSPDLFRVGQDGKPCWTGRILETFKEMRDFGLRIPYWMITEFGIDRLLSSEHDPESFIGGWMTIDNDPAKYAEQIKWAIQQYYSRAPEIAAVFIFTGTPYHPWGTYEVTEPLMDHLTVYAANLLPTPEFLKPINVVNLVGRLPKHPDWDHPDPRKRVRYWRRRKQDILDTSVHHQGFNYVGKNLKDSIRIVRSIAKNSIEKRNWPSSPYHFYIDPFGNVIQVNAYEKVVYGISGHNEHCMHVCMMVAAHKNRPSDEMLYALSDTCKMLGKPVWAHNELYDPTQCPGNRVKKNGRYAYDKDGNHVLKSWWNEFHAEMVNIGLRGG